MNYYCELVVVEVVSDEESDPLDVEEFDESPEDTSVEPESVDVVVVPPEESVLDEVMEASSPLVVEEDEPSDVESVDVDVSVVMTVDVPVSSPLVVELADESSVVDVEVIVPPFPPSVVEVLVVIVVDVPVCGPIITGRMAACASNCCN